MSLTFNDAEPVNTVAGRKAEPNPFHEVIANIAGRTDNGGQPIAKSFVLEHEEVKTAEDREKHIGKTRRQLADAGNRLDTPVTVRIHAEPVTKGPKGRETESSTQTKITFWTVKKQLRPRKPVETQTASTDQSVAVADPA